MYLKYNKMLKIKQNNLAGCSTPEVTQLFGTLVNPHRKPESCSFIQTSQGTCTRSHCWSFQVI